jgi:hypothetical protein
MTRYAQESRHLYLSGGGIAELAAPLSPFAISLPSLGRQAQIIDIAARDLVQRLGVSRIGVAHHPG